LRIFKAFNIPINKWTLPTAVLGGIFLIGFIMLIMNYNHPFSRSARIYFTTTPIIPDVKGRVIDVPVKANAPLEAGEVLFRIDPKPYEFEGTAAQSPAGRVRAERLAAQGRVRLRAFCGERSDGAARHGEESIRSLQRGK
jgi:multidrug resistance efflux pump